MEATSKKIKFKKGAASFYMVAIATLVLVIIATSFAAVIIAEIARTSNDDLAQSAYDAAMAGVEDARLAYYNYKSCLGGNKNQTTCLKENLGIEEKDEKSHRYVGECNSFAEVLGRVQVGSTGEVMVQESKDDDNGMGQAYTCVKISMPDDYLFSMNGETPMRVVKVKLADGTEAEDVKSVRVTWGPGANSDVKVEDIPDLEMSFVQTAMEFTMDDFETTVYDGGIGKTDRGTVFLDARGSENAPDPGLNETKDWFAKSNDKVASNEKHIIRCNSESNKCQATIALPEPVAANGSSEDQKKRNPDTFMFVWSLLGGVGGDVDVDVKMELCTGTDGCDASGKIFAQDTAAPEYEPSEDASERKNAALDMQVSVDSTGRANDLYRRVEVRLENGQMAMQNNMQRIYALAVGNVEKYEATCEANFGVNNCSE